MICRALPCPRKCLGQTIKIIFYRSVLSLDLSGYSRKFFATPNPRGKKRNDHGTDSGKNNFEKILTESARPLRTNKPRKIRGRQKKRHEKGGVRNVEQFTALNIDFESKIISVSRSWSSKNGFTSTKNQKTRIIPISEELLQYLKELRLLRGSEEFILPRLSEWERGCAAKVTKSFCKTLGITEIRFHARLLLNLGLGVRDGFSPDFREWR